MSKLKNIIKMLAKEVIDEMSGTGAVAGYATPFAFSKGGKNQATKAIEKLGFKTVDEKMDPIGKEDADVNNDGKLDFHEFLTAAGAGHFDKKLTKE